MDSPAANEGIVVFNSNIFSISQLFAATIPRSLWVITEALKQISANHLKNPNYSAMINLKDVYYKLSPTNPLSYYLTEATIKKVSKLSPRANDGVLTTIDDLLNVASSDPSGNLLKKLILLLTFHARNVNSDTNPNIEGLLWTRGKFIRMIA